MCFGFPGCSDRHASQKTKSTSYLGARGTKEGAQQRIESAQSGLLHVKSLVSKDTIVSTQTLNPKP